MLFLDDPFSENDIGNMFDTFFLSFYTIEMALKIFALGFIWNETSYLRNGWNILDFSIVVTGYIPYLLGSSNVKISGLRILRVLRPLKTISSLYYLKMILMSLFSAFPMIMNAGFILFFCLLIYAITALQLFMGALKKKCFNKETGFLLPNFSDKAFGGVLCGGSDCPAPEINICGKSVANYGITNFDTVLWSLLMMFQGITLENWSVNMYAVARAVNYFTVLFFLSLSFIGAMIFLNLLASIISQAYEEQSNQKNWLKLRSSKTLTGKSPVGISHEEMRQLKLLERIHHRRMDRIKNRVYDCGVSENFVSVPKPDEIRWQDILDLKLQRLPGGVEMLDEKKEEADTAGKDKMLTEVNDLINELENITSDEKNGLLINNFIDPPKIDPKSFNHNHNNKEHYYNSENIQNKLNFMGIKLQAEIIPKRNQAIENGEVQNNESEKTPIISPELGNKTNFESVNKKTEENDVLFPNIQKKETSNSVKNVNFSTHEESLSKNESAEKLIKIAKTAMGKIKFLSNFIQNRTKSFTLKKPKLKIIDYMILVDFSKNYQSNSQQEVLETELLRRKELEKKRLNEKLKNCKCNIEYLSNHIEITEFEQKRIKKQTQIMTHLMGLYTDRIKDPKLLKNLFYGKKEVQNQLKLPIAGLSSHFALHKRRKKMVNLQKTEDAIRFETIKKLISKSSIRKSKKMRKISNINSVEENDVKMTFKNIRALLKEKMIENPDKEEILKLFSNEDDFLQIIVPFHIFLFII